MPIITLDGDLLWYDDVHRPRRPCLLRLAEPLPRPVPDADRGVIYEFAMDRRNVFYEVRAAEGDSSRLPKLARDLVPIGNGIPL